MQANNFDIVKRSYRQRLQFTQEEATNVSLKQRLWLFKLQGETNPHIEESLAPHRKVLKDVSSNIERNLIPQLACQAQPLHHLITHSQSGFNKHDHTSHKKLQDPVLSDDLSYLKLTNLRYLLNPRLYHKHQSITSRSKTTYTYEPHEKYTYQCSNHY